MDFERKLVSELKNNPKSFWKYCKTKTKSHEKVRRLNKSDGTELLTSEEKAAELNNFFSSVFVHENLHNIPTPSRVNEVALESVDITEATVKAKNFLVAITTINVIVKLP